MTGKDNFKIFVLHRKKCFIKVCPSKKYRGILTLRLPKEIFIKIQTKTFRTCGLKVIATITAEI